MTMDAEKALAKRRPYTVRIGMDALVIRADGSSIDFGDAIYHPENVAEASAYAALPPCGHEAEIAKALTAVEEAFEMHRQGRPTAESVSLREAERVLRAIVGPQPA